MTQLNLQKLYCANVIHKRLKYLELERPITWACQPLPTHGALAHPATPSLMPSVNPDHLMKIYISFQKEHISNVRSLIS